MMNILVVGLILTTIVTASVWSPSPSPPNHHDDHREVIVKEGHRVVVVEYDKEADGSTKVLISPHEVDPNDHSTGEENVHTASGEGMFSGPKELVCDAYGKCKNKIASAFSKTKDTVTETAHEVSDKAHEIEQQATDAASGALGKAKDAASGALGKAKEAGQDMGETKEKLSEKVSVGESIGKAKDTVAHGIGKAKKMAGDVVSTVKDGASKVKNFDVVDSPKRMGEDIERNVTGKIEEGIEQAKESVKKAGEKSLGEILSKLKEVSYDVLWYIWSRDIIDGVVGLIHMLGFSTAYGMCVWVTFVSSYILGRYLPRTQFGMVQSRIYPVYFKAMAYCVSAALFGHLVGQRKEIWSNMTEMFQGLSLCSALLMVLTNMVLEPRATKLMYERFKIEKEEGRGITSATKDRVVDNNSRGGATTVVRSQTNVVSERQDVLRLNEKLKRLNTYSSALNVATLVTLTWHMAYMGQRLQDKR